MIKGKTFRKEDIKLVNLDDIARTLANFLNELYDIKVSFDKTYSIISEIDITGLSVTKLKDYLDPNAYKKVLAFINSIPDLNTMVHGDFHIKNLMNITKIKPIKKTNMLKKRLTLLKSL